MGKDMQVLSTLGKHQKQHITNISNGEGGEGEEKA